MSTQPYRQDDDDLFSYDPSQDTPASDYTSLPSSAPSSPNSLLDDLYRTIDKNQKNDHDSSRFRVSLADSLYEAYADYVGLSQVVSHFQAVTETLDNITQGAFGKLYLCRRVEQNIFRRLAIHMLLQAIIEDDTKDEDGMSFKEFLSKMNITVDDDFIPTYFGSIMRISQHALNLDRALYINLCQELSITPNYLAIDSDIQAQDINNFVRRNVSEQQNIYLDNLYNIACGQNLIDNVNNIFNSQNTPNVTTL